MAILKYRDPVTKEWKQDIHIISDVSSVNGKTGVVVLNYEDVGAPSVAALTAVRQSLETHEADSVAHITAAERSKWNEDAVYVAEYGHDSFAQIKTEKAKGKEIYCLKGNEYYSLTSYNETTNAATFSADYTDSMKFASLSNTTWTSFSISYVDDVDDAADTDLVTAKGVKAAIADVTADITEHIEDTTIHITAEERTAWNAKVNESDVKTTLDTSNVKFVPNTAAVKNVTDAISEDLTEHVEDEVAHITAEERTAWNAKVDKADVKTTLDVTSANYVPNTSAVKNVTDAIASDLDTLEGEFDEHAADTDVHITTTERSTWNAKVDKANVKTTLDTTSADYVPNTSAVKNVTDAISTALETLEGEFDEHAADEDIHITTVERATWNNKVDKANVKTTLDTTSADYVPNTAAVKNVTDAISGDLTEHAGDTDIHITAAERTAWNAKVDEANVKTTLDTSNVKYVPNTAAVKNVTDAIDEKVDEHLDDETRHITAAERSTWNAKVDKANVKTTLDTTSADYVPNTGAVKNAVDAVAEDLSDHEADTVKHITAAERTTWNAKQDALANAALLATYTQTEAALASAVADDHIHGNKAILDAIEEAPATDAALTAEITAREDADENLQSQIDAIEARSDVTDVVGTKAELLAYDTSKLSEDDIIKVLADESQGGARTYYRWHEEEWVLIGSEGTSYTKAETDALLNDKADADDLDDHVNNTTVHITSTERERWNTGIAAIGASLPLEYQNLWVDTDDSTDTYTDPSIRWDMDQDLNDVQKATARRNLGLENLKETELIGKDNGGGTLGVICDTNVLDKRVVILVDVAAHAEDLPVQIQFGEAKAAEFVDKASSSNHIYRVDGIYSSEEDRWMIYVNDEDNNLVCFSMTAPDAINTTLLELTAEPDPTKSVKEFTSCGVSFLPSNSRMTLYAHKGEAIE